MVHRREIERKGDCGQQDAPTRSQGGIVSLCTGKVIAGGIIKSLPTFSLRLDSGTTLVPTTD